MRKNATIADVNQSSKAVLIAGPTGVGKSLFAVELAHQLGGEILCADSFQIYAGMAILTAQPGAALLSVVPHHLYGTIPVQTDFNVGQYAVLAGKQIAEIQSRGKRPLIVGGSGLYLRALMEGLSPLPPSSPDLRAQLEAESEEERARKLLEIDPSAAQLVDMKNPRRVLRALEICILTGRALSENRNQRQPVLDDHFGILLLRDREELHERIEENVRSMFRAGVVEEVSTLRDIGNTAAKAIGLRPIHELISGKMSELECIQSIALATRQYAKRQLTWFRNQCNFLSINLTALRNPQDASDLALKSLRGVDE